LYRAFRRLLLSFALLAACRQVTPPVAQAQGVKWTLDIPGVRLKEGRLRTIPPRLEESLLSAVANGSFVSSNACAKNLPTVAASASLTFNVDVDGSVREAAAFRGGDTLSGCIARQLGSVPLAGVSLSAKTGVTLQLIFAASPTDGGTL